MRAFDGLTLTEAREAYRTLLKLRRIADPDYKARTRYERWVEIGGCGVRPHHFTDDSRRLVSSKAQATLARVRAYVRDVLPGALICRVPRLSCVAGVYITIHDGGHPVFYGYVLHRHTTNFSLEAALEEHTRRNRKGPL